MGHEVFDMSVPTNIHSSFEGGGGSEETNLCAA
jgi:hypothetical protein